jgi:hypothetical protein
MRIDASGRLTSTSLQNPRALSSRTLSPDVMSTLRACLDSKVLYEC